MVLFQLFIEACIMSSRRIKGSSHEQFPITMVRFLSLLFLLRASMLADAYAMILESQCADIIFPNGDRDTSCFSVAIIGPSIALTTLPNGTEVTEYVCSYSVTYSYEGGNDAGLMTEVTWEGEETNVCAATAAREVCLACTLCPDGTVSADCTNLAGGGGRSIPCGESPVRGLGPRMRAATRFTPSR